MGNNIFFDKQLSSLDDLLTLNTQALKKIKMPITSHPKQIDHYIKLWRIYEPMQYNQQVISEPINIEQISAFTCYNTECYLLLIISKNHQTKIQNSHKIELSNIFKLVIQSTRYIQQQVIFQTTYQCYAATIYLYKGTQISNKLLLMSSSYAFRLEKLMKSGQEILIEVLLNGYSMKSKKLQRGTLDNLKINSKDELFESNVEIDFIKKILNIEKPKQYKLLLEFNQKLNYQSMFKKIIAQQDKKHSKLEFLQPNVEPFNLSITQIRQNEKYDENNQSIAFNENQIVIAKGNNDSLMDFNIFHSDKQQKIEKQEIHKQEIHQLKDYEQQISPITDRVYISGQYIAYSLEKLKQHNITLIINCAANYCINRFPSQFQYLSFFTKDSAQQNIECIFYKTIEKIQEHILTGSVLIHCVAGVSRSAAIVIAYLIFKLKISYEKAQRMVKQKRPVVSPNIGFTGQLLTFYTRLFEPYQKLYVRPKIFGVCSYQQQSPSELVCKYIDIDLKLGWQNILDSRGIFIIQHKVGLYVWIGNNCKFVKEYLQVAQNYIKKINKYQKTKQSVIQIKEGSESVDFLKLCGINKMTNEKSNKKLLYLDIRKNGCPQGLQNKQSKLLTFKFPNHTPISHVKLSEKNYYLKCKQSSKCVQIIIWQGKDWQGDEIQKKEFLGDIVNYYYKHWDHDQILIHERSYDFSQESF